MRKRKTAADYRAEGRTRAIAEVCRVLKWHLGYALIADQLWDAMSSGQKLREGPGGPAVTVPPLEMSRDGYANDKGP